MYLLSRPSEKQIRNLLLLAAPAACRRPHDHGINCNIPTVNQLLSVWHRHTLGRALKLPKGCSNATRVHQRTTNSNSI